MQLAASSVAEVVDSLASTAATGQRITKFDLRRMDRVLAYTPEDMTVTVEAGVTLAVLQQKLSEHGQFLAVDPPNSSTLTIGALLAGNSSGPRRYGYGTIRDYLLGIKVVLADGRVIKAGGQVVKNVAGYDLCKLFVGSRGTLGVIVEATFKVLPRPEVETFVQTTVPTTREVQLLLNEINAAPLTPVVLDACTAPNGHALVLGFAGPREDVEWQVNRARDLELTETSSLDHERMFWEPSEPTHTISVLPSKLSSALDSITPRSYVARAGNGVIYFRRGRAPAQPQVPRELMRRIKDTYDPKSLLPELPW